MSLAETGPPGYTYVRLHCWCINNRPVLKELEQYRSLWGFALVFLQEKRTMLGCDRSAGAEGVGDTRSSMLQGGGSSCLLQLLPRLSTHLAAG